MNSARPQKDGSPFDNMVNTMLLLQPHMNEEWRRQFEIILKLREIKNIFDMYSATARDASRNGCENWQSELLHSLKPYVNEYGCRRIDVMLSFLNFKNCFESFNRQG
jgi:hypothetical protein